MSSYVLSECPLISLNGIYVRHPTKDVFVHTSGDFELLRDKAERWLIQSVIDGTILATSTVSNIGVHQATWTYYSLENNQFMPSNRMNFLYQPEEQPPATQTAATAEGEDPLRVDEQATKQEEQLRLAQQLVQQQQAQLKAQQEEQSRAHQESQLRAQQEAQLRTQQKEQLRAQREEQLRAFQKAQEAAQLRAQHTPALKPSSTVAPYSRNIPELYSNSFPEDWGKTAVYTSVGFWATPIELFENHRTCEKRTTRPLDTHNIYSYHIRAGQQDIKVFAPHQALVELRKTPLQQACLDGTKELEEFWTSTVCAYEHKIAGMQHYLRQLQETEAQKYEAYKADMKAENEKLQADIAGLQKLNDDLTARAGKASGFCSDFPAGEDLRNEFQAAFLNFESFACDAINCLEDLQLENPGEAFVRQVMSSLFEATKEHVKSRLDAKKAQLKQLYGVEVRKDGLAKDGGLLHLFWYQTQQVQFPAEIRAITDQQIFALMEQAHQLIPVLHQRMLQAADEAWLTRASRTSASRSWCVTCCACTPSRRSATPAATCSRRPERRLTTTTQCTPRF
jgi:septum formation inhibitor MinC